MVNFYIQMDTAIWMVNFYIQMDTILNEANHHEHVHYAQITSQS